MIGQHEVRGRTFESCRAHGSTKPLSKARNADERRLLTGFEGDRQHLGHLDAVGLAPTLESGIAPIVGNAAQPWRWLGGELGPVAPSFIAITLWVSPIGSCDQGGR
jgi:hypothetical protein